MVGEKMTICTARRIVEKTLERVETETMAARDAKQSEYEKRNDAIDAPYLKRLCALETEIEKDLIKKYGKDRVNNFKQYNVSGYYPQKLCKISEKEDKYLGTLLHNGKLKKEKIQKLFNEFEMDVLSGYNDGALQIFLKKLQAI